MQTNSTNPSFVNPNIGHNSKAFGERLRDDIETVLSDDHEAVFRYAQWHIGDYITGTMGMGLEHEGAYIRFLMRLYQRGKPLPDDDSFMATCMNLSIRVWRRVKQALISVGKIIARNGCLTNARFEKERLHRADEMRKKAQAAQARWQKSRAKKDSLKEVSPKFEQNLDETSSKISENKSKKLNEINVSDEKVDMLTNNQQPITNKKDTVPKGTGTDVPESDLRSMIWDQGINWLRPQAHLNEARLRTRIGGWIKDYGPGAVLNAIATAQEKKPVSAMDYVEGCLRRIGNSGSNGKSWHQRQRDRRAILTEILAEA